VFAFLITNLSVFGKYIEFVISVILAVKCNTFHFTYLRDIPK
jgi:hypothetical protein